MIQYKRLGQVALSPDGRLVAYKVTSPIIDHKSSEYRTHIWVVRADGSFDYQFTRGESSCSDPAFSPDGLYLAYKSKRDGDDETQIWLSPLTGGEAVRLTHAEAGVNRYRWSPDGRQIAYTMDNPPTEEEKTRKEQKRDVRILDSHFDYAHLYVIDIAAIRDPDRTARRLTNGNFHVTSLDWSPDGKSIAFAHQATPGFNDWPSSDISKVRVDEAKVTSLVAGPGADTAPHFSPDGRWLAFASDAGDIKWAFANDIYIMAAEGGAPRKLAETPDQRPTIVAWSKDSKQVFFEEVDGSSRRLFSLPADGKAHRTVTTGVGNFEHAAFSNDGTFLAYVRQTTATPQEVFITPVRSMRPQQLTDVHSDYPKFRMGKTEVISWRSKDGTDVEGLLTYPIDRQIDELYPLILMIHGGPTGVYTEYFTGRSNIYPIQAFAQQGYAVLRANPRGSSGYGKSFRFANYNDWGFGDYEDLMAGVSKVIGMGVAHPDSLCVMGWSYGGYMTSFIITKSSQFKAASVGAGITNLMSFTGTSDVPDFLPDYFGGQPWEQLDDYMKHSAMFQIKGVTTPTQILHGQDDPRVPISQSLELYHALKGQGCPVEMITYPRTRHGIREPKFIQDAGERIIAWFNRHLRKRADGKTVVTK